MNIDEEQFKKAQSFVVDLLDNSERTKEGLLNVISMMDDKWKETENIDFRRSLMFLASQMKAEIDNYKQD